MEFASAAFLLFFPLTALLHYALPLATRRLFLLAASYAFYLRFNPAYALLLLATTLVDFALARRLAACAAPKRKRAWLLVGLAHNLTLLVGFKYLGFLLETLAPLLRPLSTETEPALALLAPVGISYYTFKKISYLIEVRRGAAPAADLAAFALYVSCFPAVMAGPIDRPGTLLPQVARPAAFAARPIAAGLQLMAWGFFKKLVIADRLAQFVARVYDGPAHPGGPAVAAATIYFSIQIYCDFSAYTDIARGAARVLGYELGENFRRPYLATSIGEFWRRWHVSLSSWLMDYLFLPIAYAVSRRIRSPRLLRLRAETWAYLAGILATMLLCGLWHGAQWTFVVWGGLHGLYLGASFAGRRLRRRALRASGLSRHPRLRALLGGLLCFGLVSFAWIFFRAASVTAALALVAELGRGWGEALRHPASLPGLLALGLMRKELAVALIAAALLLLADWRRGGQPLEEWTASHRPVVRWAIYLGLLLAVLTFADTAAEAFIYFRF